MKVGVLDYGVGNLGSVFRALEELHSTPLLINQAFDVHHADALILPGVGSFTECKKILDCGGWTEAIRDEVLTHHKPLLGICLGMQLLADLGEEGASQTSPSHGLGLIRGRVVSLKDLGCQERIPHAGWNSVFMTGNNSLLEGIPNATDFYFVHSYAFVPDDPSDTIAVTNYGVTITAAVSNGNVWGTQFHPEKSSRAGFKLLKNFIQTRQC